MPQAQKLKQASKRNIKNAWANQYVELPNQSNFHEGVREIFREDPWFKHLNCYQEVPVIDLVPEYYTNQHRFDWYIEELNIVLELHGEQHYKAVSFGAMSYDQKQKAFEEGQRRDASKKLAAEEKGFKYIAISYKEKSRLTGEYLKNILLGKPQ